MRTFYGTSLSSPLMLGTANYPSPATLAEAFSASRASVATVSLRRERGDGPEFWQQVNNLGVHVLPNTAGCYSAQEAITTAHMAREYFQTDWIKLEVIGNRQTLQPDPFGLLEAAQVLCAEGFQVFPYTTEDLVVAERLVDLGCEVLMPWASPIGSGRGLMNPYALRQLREHFPDIALVVDAGLGLPSHATQAMEMGYDAVLLNTAVAEAAQPVQMARAFAKAVAAGKLAATSGPIPVRKEGKASTPEHGKAELL